MPSKAANVATGGLMGDLIGGIDYAKEGTKDETVAFTGKVVRNFTESCGKGDGTSRQFVVIEVETINSVHLGMEVRCLRDDIPWTDRLLKDRLPYLPSK